MDDSWTKSIPKNIFLTNFAYVFVKMNTYGCEHQQKHAVTLSVTLCLELNITAK